MYYYRLNDGKIFVILDGMTVKYRTLDRLKIYELDNYL